VSVVLVPVDSPGGEVSTRNRPEGCPNTSKSTGNRIQPPTTRQILREEGEGQGEVSWDPGLSAGKSDIYSPTLPAPLRVGGGGEGGRRHAETQGKVGGGEGGPGHQRGADWWRQWASDFIGELFFMFSAVCEMAGCEMAEGELNFALHSQHEICALACMVVASGQVAVGKWLQR